MEDPSQFGMRRRSLRMPRRAVRPLACRAFRGEGSRKNASAVARHNRPNPINPDQIKPKQTKSDQKGMRNAGKRAGFKSLAVSSNASRYIQIYGSSLFSVE